MRCLWPLASRAVGLTGAAVATGWSAHCQTYAEPPHKQNQATDDPHYGYPAPALLRCPTDGAQTPASLLRPSRPAKPVSCPTAAQQPSISAPAVPQRQQWHRVKLNTAHTNRGALASLHGLRYFARPRIPLPAKLPSLDPAAAAALAAASDQEKRRVQRGRLLFIGFVLVWYCIRYMVQEPITGPRVFLEFASEGQPLGTVVIGFHERLLPDVADNFRGLAKGDRGYGYHGSNVHTIVPGLAIFAGDITHGDGSGGRAYGGRWLQPEALKPSGNPIHAYMTQRPLGVRYGRGVVSMLVKPENDMDAIRSQFLIGVLKPPVASGDKALLGCGRVLEGMDVIDRLSRMATDENRRPILPVTISACGVLPAPPLTLATRLHMLLKGYLPIERHTVEEDDPLYDVD